MGFALARAPSDLWEPECGTVTAKTTSQRVEKLRQEREALGLRRRELYAHDDDWPKVREVASKLLREREEQTKS